MSPMTLVDCEELHVRDCISLSMHASDTNIDGDRDVQARTRSSETLARELTRFRIFRQEIKSEAA